MYKEYRIAQIGEVVGGGTPSTKNDTYWNGDIPWIAPSDLTGYSSVYISRGENNITKSGLNKSGAKLLPKNTVLFSSRAPIGYVAIAENPLCTNQGFKSIICDESIVDPLYLYYYIKANLDYFKLWGSGATFPEISGNAMKKIKIRIIEDTKKQKEISSLLYSYDNLIEVNNKRIKVLEQMAENLYKEWFVRFRFPGHENAEFEDDIPRGWTLSSGIENKRPKNWHYGSFSELGEFVRGKNIISSEMVEGSVPVISAGIDPSGYHSKSNVKGKSLTISASGANAGYLKYNLHDIWAADCSYYQNEDYIWFAYHTLRFLQPKISNLQCGAAQPHVHPKQINELSVIIPPDYLIINFCSMVEPMYNEIQNLLNASQKLIKQRDLLLPRFMSGTLEI